MGHVEFALALRFQTLVADVRRFEVGSRRKPACPGKPLICSQDFSVLGVEQPLLMLGIDQMTMPQFPFADGTCVPAAQTRRQAALQVCGEP